MIQFNVMYDLTSEQEYLAEMNSYPPAAAQGERFADRQPKLPCPGGPQIARGLKEDVESQLQTRAQEISTALETLFGDQTAPRSVTVRISSYGMGGSYHLPGDWSRPGYAVTIRKDRLVDVAGVLKTNVLMHELIHVCIEQQLRDKGWPRDYDRRREWLVDEIMRSNECQALCPGHGHQYGPEARPDAGLDEICFVNRPTYPTWP